MRHHPDPRAGNRALHVQIVNGAELLVCKDYNFKGSVRDYLV